MVYVIIFANFHVFCLSIYLFVCLMVAINRFLKFLFSISEFTTTSLPVTVRKFCK